MTQVFDYCLAKHKPGTKGDLLATAITTMEKVLIPEVLEHYKGSITKSALLLGIERTTLRRKMLQHNITINKEVKMPSVREEVNKERG